MKFTPPLIIYLTNTILNTHIFVIVIDILNILNKLILINLLSNFVIIHLVSVIGNVSYLIDFE